MAFKDRPNSSFSDSSIYIHTHLLIILKTEFLNDRHTIITVIRLIM